MQQHVPKGNDSRVQPGAVFSLAAIRGARHRIEHAGSRPKRESTSLPPGGMTKARVPELRIAGSEMFTLSQSFGPEPEVGFGDYRNRNT